MAKKITDFFNKKQFLITNLRRISYKYPPRTTAMNRARVDRGIYKCNLCQNSFNRKFINVDHIAPVIDIAEGFTTWDNYINRLFCEVEGFQILCTTCHSGKTILENTKRAKNKVDKAKLLLQTKDTNVRKRSKKQSKKCKPDSSSN